MVKADHGYSKKFGQENVPFWERKRFVLNQAAREKRQKEIENEGWHVLRYSEDQINDCLDDVEAEVFRLVANHKGEYNAIINRIKEDIFL